MHIDLRWFFLLACLLVLAFIAPRFIHGSMASDKQVFLEVHHAPIENLEKIDNHELQLASISVEMKAYSLTDIEMITTLKSLAMRGIIICLYLDNDQTKNELHRPDLRSALLDLATTRNVTVLVKHSQVLQHDKEYVIDSHIYRGGSANFSHSALVDQDNHLFLTDSRPALQGFYKSFNLDWGRPDNIPLVQFAQASESR